MGSTVFDSVLFREAVEITDDQFCYQTISRKSETVDSGVLDLQSVKAAGASQ